MLEYPRLAIGAISYLMRRYNDLDIYVEDRRYLSIYAILAARALGARAKVRMVIPLGGREEVLDACAKADWTKGRRQIFLLDGDFDLLLGRQRRRMRGLYQLNAYCIENLLLDVGAILSVSQDMNDALTPAQVSQQLDLDVWLLDVVNTLLPLFILYAIAEDKQLGVQTSAYSVEKLCRQWQKSAALCPIKTEARVKSMTAQLEAALGAKVLQQEARKIRNRIGNAGAGSSKYISGKTYLLPLVFHRMRALFRKNSDVAALRNLLAHRLDLRPHSEFVRKMRKAGSGAH